MVWQQPAFIPPSIVACQRAAAWSSIAIQTNGFTYWKDASDHTQNWFDWPMVESNNLFLELTYIINTFDPSPHLFVEFFDADSASLGVMQYPQGSPSAFHSSETGGGLNPIVWETVQQPARYVTPLHLPPFPAYKCWSDYADPSYIFNLTMFSAPNISVAGHG